MEHKVASPRAAKEASRERNAPRDREEDDTARKELP